MLAFNIFASFLTRGYDITESHNYALLSVRVF